MKIWICILQGSKSLLPALQVSYMCVSKWTKTWGQLDARQGVTLAHRVAADVHWPTCITSACAHAATHTHYTSYAAAIWPMSLEGCPVAKAGKKLVTMATSLEWSKKTRLIVYSRDSTKPESLAKISLVDVETMSIGLIKIGVKKETRT